MQPVTSTSANASIEKAVAAGISGGAAHGRIESDAFTTEIRAGPSISASHGGLAGSKQVGNDGKIWSCAGWPATPRTSTATTALMQSL